MKILYIAHYKEGSGWSQAAIDYILSLDSVGIDVVCRNVKLTTKECQVPDRILELENKNLKNVDYCIQHVLPHHLVSTNKFKKNVAYFVGETSTIKHLNWFELLLNMDEVWVPSVSYRHILNRDGLSNVVCVPHTFDLAKYDKKYPQINFNQDNHRFKFYYIGEVSDRKNIQSILKCYYSEFTNEDDVLLILKLRKFGLNPQQLNSYIENLTQSIKKELRIYKNLQDYPKILTITADFTEDHINALHQSCDCFVGISHGEAWSIPSFDAMCFGKTPICSNEGGPSEFIDTNNHATGLLIDGVYETCIHSDPAFPDLFTGKEEWFCPSESLTKQAMRFILEERKRIDRNAGLERGKNFSYKQIGNLIKAQLNDQ